MTKSGFLISRSKANREFFTAASAYDRPQWKPLKEATVYPTADLAQNAVVKLFKNGCYEARLVPVAEAITFEFPNGEEVTTPHTGKKSVLPTGNQYPDEEHTLDPGSVEQDGSGEMTADDNDEVCPICGHSPCTCGEHEDQDDIDTEQQFDDRIRDRRAGHAELEPGEHDILGYRESQESKSCVVENAFTMPAKPQADAQPSENKTTAKDYKSGVEKIKFSQPAMTDDAVDFGGDEQSEKVSVPSEVITDLKAKIAEYEKVAEMSNMRDDARASFALTAAEAMKTLLADIEESTVESIKRAQINMSSWMSPITNNVPASVQKFVYRGGKKPTLHDLFAEKRSSKKE